MCEVEGPLRAVSDKVRPRRSVRRVNWRLLAPVLVERLCARFGQALQQAGLSDEDVEKAQQALKLALLEMQTTDADAPVKGEIATRMVQLLSLQGMSPQLIAHVVDVLEKFPG